MAVNYVPAAADELEPVTPSLYLSTEIRSQRPIDEVWDAIAGEEIR